MMHKVFVAIVLAASLSLAPAAQAQQHRATHFGNPQTRFSRPFTDAESLRNMLRAQAGDVQSVLKDAGWPGDFEDLGRGIGTDIRSVSIPPNTLLPFIAARKNGRAIVMKSVLWAGRQPIDALYFEFASKCRVYRFVVPKVCGNFWVEDIGEDASCRVEKVIETRPEPPPQYTPAPPPPVVVIEEKRSRLPFFVAAYGGKERLTHDDLGASYCSPIAGAAVGFNPMISDNLQLEGAVGYKYAFEDEAHSALYADAAVNFVMGSGFVGAGASYWDISQDTSALGLLVQAGVGFGDNWQVVAQGRAPFNRFDNLDNNYQVWGGVRFRP